MPREVDYRSKAIYTIMGTDWSSELRAAAAAEAQVYALLHLADVLSRGSRIVEVE